MFLHTTNVSAVLKNVNHRRSAATAIKKGVCNVHVLAIQNKTIRDGDHSWACCGTNVGPSFVQRNNIDPLQTKVKDAVIGTGNGNEEVAPNLGGHPVPNHPG